MLLYQTSPWGVQLFSYEKFAWSLHTFMFVYQTNPVRVQLFSYINTFFCHVVVPNQSCESSTLFLCKHFHLFQFICWLLDTCVRSLYNRPVWLSHGLHFGEIQSCQNTHSETKRARYATKAYSTVQARLVIYPAGTYYWEPATPIISQCNGIFTDQSIFRYFSCEVPQFQST